MSIETQTEEERIFLDKLSKLNGQIDGGSSYFGPRLPPRSISSNEIDAGCSSLDIIELHSESSKSIFNLFFRKK